MAAHAPGARLMRERPILFSGPMVRAILDGRKTQTRRVVKPQPESVDLDARKIVAYTGGGALLQENLLCPFGGPRDRLWVRETWAPMCRTADPHCWCADDPARQKNHFVEYRADTNDPYPGEWPAEDARGYADAPKWRPSIHMPRWASRLTLEVTGVRVQRLQQITATDVQAEGWRSSTDDALVPGFAQFWDSLNAARGYGWDANPWVWVVEFTVLAVAATEAAHA